MFGFTVINVIYLFVVVIRNLKNLRADIMQQSENSCKCGNIAVLYCNNCGTWACSDCYDKIHDKELCESECYVQYCKKSAVKAYTWKMINENTGKVEKETVRLFCLEHYDKCHDISYISYINSSY